MKRAALFSLLAVALVWAASPPPQDQPDEEPSEEERLQMAIAEAGTSTVDLIRALENHLARYPKTSRRPEIERALAKAAMETKDERRVILYGEKVLARDPNDILILERVARALLTREDPASAERALDLAHRYKRQIQELRNEKAPGRTPPATWREETDRGLARALLLEARATGNLGKLPGAVSLARQAYETYPSAEAAREVARWLSRSGREEEAIRYYADAFSIPDPRNTETDRASVRARMGELYRKLKGSETGLGDLILEAYDRTTGLLASYRVKLRQTDPNAQLTNPLDFTVSGLNGEKLALSTLKGKVVVLDFWATWCGPCRVQQPLYEEVKQRFKHRPDVVFLAINTDEDRDVVPHFLQQQKWNKDVYFEDGLSAALQVSSIPTTIVIGKRGEVVSRMNGFIPERFVEMLGERIQEALGQ